MSLVCHHCYSRVTCLENDKAWMLKLLRHLFRLNWGVIRLGGGVKFIVGD